MYPIYVGDGRNIAKRIRSNHTAGNIEGSSFRRHIAEAWKLEVKTERRLSGSTRIRLDLPDQQRKDAEARITEYARAGKWRTVLCANYDEAHDFQWFCLQKLDPHGALLLNSDRESPKSRNADRYNELWAKLMSPGNPLVSRDEIGSERAGPGVYVFYHEWRPEAWPHAFRLRGTISDTRSEILPDGPTEDKLPREGQRISSRVWIVAAVLAVLALVLLPVIKKGLSWKPAGTGSSGEIVTETRLQGHRSDSYLSLLQI